MATNVWRLTAGRPVTDGRNSTEGRLDFVLQVLPPHARVRGLRAFCSHLICCKAYCLTMAGLVAGWTHLSNAALRAGLARRKPLLLSHQLPLQLCALNLAIILSLHDGTAGTPYHLICIYTQVTQVWASERYLVPNGICNVSAARMNPAGPQTGQMPTLRCSSCGRCLAWMS